MRLRLSRAVTTSTSVVCASGCLTIASSSSSARVAASLSRFGASSVSACRTVTTRRGTIIGSVRTAAMIDATPSSSRSPVVQSPAWMRSTLKARSSSSTSPASSAASADFSISSSPWRR